MNINFFTIAHAQAVTPLDSSVTIDTLGVRLIGWALYLGGAIAVIYIIIGGITYITAGGDETKIEQGRNTLTFAIIGVIIIALSIVIINWLGQFLNNPTP